MIDCELQFTLVRSIALEEPIALAIKLRMAGMSESDTIGFISLLQRVDGYTHFKKLMGGPGAVKLVV